MNKVLKFIHITDTHLLDDETKTFKGINTKNSLELVLSESVEHYPDLDFILITGDISQTGLEPSYLTFKSIIQNISVPFYCVPGNHDSPELLQNVISSSPTDSIKTIDLDCVTLVLINSWFENHHHGYISKQNLEQLNRLLIKENKKTFIIAIHHSPVLINSKWLDKLCLQNREEFLNLLKKHHADILVFFGHVHQSIEQQISNLHFISTPSTCHQFKPHTDETNVVYDPPPSYRYLEYLNSSIKCNNLHHVK